MSTNKRHNIIVYATDFPVDDFTAPGLHISHVCKELAAQGWEVRLYAPSISVKIQGVQARVLSSPHVMRTFFFQLRFLAAVLFDLPLRRRAVALYARQSVFLWAHAAAAKLLRIPLITEVNGRLLEEIAPRRRSVRYSLLTGLCTRILNYSFKRATRCIAVSEGIKAYVIERHGVKANKIAVINNGVDSSRFHPIDQIEAQRQLNLKSSHYYISFVGNLVSWQGLAFIVSALGYLPVGVRLLVVGDGPEHANLRLLVTKLGLQDRVLFTGKVKNDAVPLYIAASDLCVYYPLRVRGDGASPFKVYEYLACGRPVIAADLAGIRREFGEQLLYCPPESPQALAEMIRKTLSHNHKMRENALYQAQVVSQSRSWKAVAEQISHLLVRTLSTFARKKYRAYAKQTRQQVPNEPGASYSG